MAQPPAPHRPRKAGGCLLVAAIVLGVLIGTAFNQTSVGLLAGIATGAAAAVAVWLIDRRPG